MNGIDSRTTKYYNDSNNNNNHNNNTTINTGTFSQHELRQARYVCQDTYFTICIGLY